MALVFALLSFITVGLAANCGMNRANYISGSGTISCTYGFRGTEDWFGPAGAACTVKVVDSVWAYSSTYEWLQILDNGKTLTTISNGYSGKGAIFNVSSYLQVKFNEKYTNNGGNTRFSLEYNCGESPLLTLVSGQDMKVRNTTSRGGFVYFTLPRALQEQGASLEYNFLIGTYRGLKQPSFFLSNNRLPTLESYQWTNATAPSSTKGDWTWTYKVNSPSDGSYVVGMFLYGTYSRIVANAKWTYNIPTVPLDEPKTYTLTANNFWYGLIQVPVDSPSFSVEVAREVPGGNTTFYLKQGAIPSSTDYDRTFGVNSFDSYKVDTTRNPNPSTPNPQQQNPGVWVLRASSNTAAGFLMKVSVNSQK